MSPDNKPKILVVDDEAGVREVCRHSIAAAGLGVLTASSGAEALGLLETSGPIGAVFADHGMPGMSGVELLEALWARFPRVTRVLFTGGHDIRIAQEATLRGRVFRFLVKPVAPSLLRAVAREALERWQPSMSASPVLEGVAGPSAAVGVARALQAYARQGRRSSLFGLAGRR